MCRSPALTQVPSPRLAQRLTQGHSQPGGPQKQWCHIPRPSSTGLLLAPVSIQADIFFHFSGKKHLVDYLKPARDRATRLPGAVPRRLGTYPPPHARPTSSPLRCERGDHTRKEHPQPRSGLHSPSLASFQLPASPQGTGRSQQAHGEEEEEEVAMQAGASSEAAILSSGTGSPR